MLVKMHKSRYNEIGDLMETKQSSKNIFNGKVIRVTEDEVLCRNQQTSTRECVYAPGGVGILALVDGKIILVKQYRYVVQEYTIEIPAGKIEPSEDLQRCAARELEEETGYRASKLSKISSFYPTPGFCGEELHIYEAFDCVKVDNPLAMDDDEDLELIEIDLDEAFEWVQKGIIKDSKTIIAIQYAKIFKKV